jgi:hypothetical protein
LPEDPEEFAVVCRRVFKSSRAGMFEDCLTHNQKQSKIDFEDYTELVDQLVSIGNKKLVDKNYDKLVQRPLEEWKGFIQRCIGEEYQSCFLDETVGRCFESLVQVNWPINKTLISKSSEKNL